MSNNKRYYWLKLTENFFEDDTIIYIESQPNGHKYINFYLKLCLKSLKTEGKLMRFVGENLIPYEIESLARLTNCEIDTVRAAMQLFEAIGIIQVLDTGAIYLTQIEEMVGSETDKARSMRRIRAEKNMQVTEGNIVTPMLPKCYPEYRDKSIENRDKSIEDTEYIISDEMNDTEYTASDEAVPDRFMNVYFYFLRKYQETFNKPHDQLSESALQKVLKAFQNEDITNEYIDVYFGSDEHKGLIGESDGSIFHFINPTVMDLCRARVAGSCYT